MPISPSGKPKILITMGDPSGIGPEIILKSLASPKIRRLANFLIIGDHFVLHKTNRRLGVKGPLKIIDHKNVSQKGFKFGQVNKAYGRASIEYLKTALSVIEANKQCALVTAPISKEAINKAGFHYSGHTEFLSKATKTSKFAMVLIGGPLRVALLTRHISIKDVPRSISQKNIIDVITLTHTFLAGYLNKKYPKIAVASLNPHGGEGGIFGDEEKKIILPAIIKAKKKYKNVHGPLPSDAVFYDAYRGKVDGVLCMYHDQGLIPLKMIARDKGVNITLGLPFIRTSPDHGTAFNIAGKNAADPSSMTEAIKTAVKLASMKC